MEDDKLRADFNRGIQAKALLNDPLLNETLDYLQQSYVQAWKACTTVELREKAWDLCKASEKLKEHLEKVLSDGRLAEVQIRELVRRAA